AVVARHGGAFPSDAQALRALPGIGPYTAGAIAAIAFDRRALAVDGNVERVAARLAAIATPLPAAKAEIGEVAASLMPRARPGDFAQALMDLGATTCTPRAPSCGRCPLAAGCAARATGRQEEFPVKPPRRARPLRRGVAFVLRDARGAVWLTRRAEKGLLGGMVQVPTTDWIEGGPDEASRAAARPAPGPWRLLGETVRHVFTHFELELEVEVAVARRAPDGEGRWCAPGDLARAGLPSVFRKVAAAATGGARRR
ncbi:MAG: A/G-specific adenine glycosylase, partial [Alphaproteobacteria bacterium]|nr:A/G-specific adenine glycosylase [Alphaproteobacteria bacterium]